MTPDHPSSTAAFVLSQRVYWEDTDAGGIVYYANYLKFLERARTEWLRSHGCDQVELARRDGLAFVVRSVNIEFLRPARLDDLLLVRIDSMEVGGGVVRMRQSIERSGERIASADVKLACVKLGALQPVRIPAALRAVFSQPRQSPGTVSMPLTSRSQENTQ
jgi:acyl-CoA thioester hydrolase